MEEKATCVELATRAEQEQREKQSRRERLSSILSSIVWGITMFFTFVMAFALLGLMVACLVFMVAYFAVDPGWNDFTTATLSWIIRLAILLGGSFILTMLFFILGMRFDDGAFIAMDEMDFETEIWERSGRGLEENA